VSAVLETCVSDFCLTQVPADLHPPVNEIVSNFYILYAVVKEPGFLIFGAMVFSRDGKFPLGDGGPCWTRTSDPRLIKAVL